MTEEGIQRFERIPARTPSHQILSLRGDPGTVESLPLGNETSLFAVSLVETGRTAVKTDETRALTPTPLVWLRPDDLEKAFANWYDSSTELRRPLNFISWFFFTCTSRNCPKLTRPRNP